jgi:hypothetical protein
MELTRMPLRMMPTVEFEVPRLPSTCGIMPPEEYDMPFLYVVKSLEKLL